MNISEKTKRNQIYLNNDTQIDRLLDPIINYLMDKVKSKAYEKVKFNQVVLTEEEKYDDLLNVTFGYSNTLEDGLRVNFYDNGIIYNICYPDGKKFLLVDSTCPAYYLLSSLIMYMYRINEKEIGNKYEQMGADILNNCEAIENEFHFEGEIRS